MKTSDLPQNIKREAADWLARSLGDDWSAENERAFQEWMAADARHAAAFKAVNTVWVSAAALPRPMLQQRVHSRPVLDRRLLLGGIAAAGALGGTFAFMSMAAAKTYVTDVGEQKHVALEDGTEILLDTNTKLVVTFSDKTRLVDLRYGRANFRVAGDAKRNFEVKAANRLVQGGRSIFDVRRDGDDVSVVIIEGQVTVTGGAADVRTAQRLGVGDRLTSRAASAPKLDKPNLQPLLAWQTGQAIFDGEPLPGAVAEMNRYSTLKLDVADARIAKFRVSGVYRVGDNLTFARSLTRLLPVTLLQQDDRIALIGDSARLTQG